jgi:hypothetical protein
LGIGPWWGMITTEDATFASIRRAVSGQTTRLRSLDASFGVVFFIPALRAD